MNIQLALIAGIDIPIPGCQLIIHQPTIREIAYIGETEFFTGVQALCVNKDLLLTDKSDPDDLTNFQVFMTIISSVETQIQKKHVIDVLMLLLPEYKISFTPRSVLFNKADQNVILDEGNFDKFQDILRQVFCVNSGPSDQTTFNPQDEKAKEIAKKLLRGRQRVAQQKGESAGTVFTQYVSILTIALHSMSLQQVLNLTVFQLYDLIERYGLYIQWDLDIKSRLAGGKSDQKPDNWMKIIH